MAEATTFGPFLFHRQRMKLTCAGRSVALGGRGTSLLAALVDARGGVVPKDALMNAAWPATSVAEANLTVQIAALRRALATWCEDECIVTVPRVGYRLAVPPVALGAKAGQPTIAVLPFENLSSDPEQGYLADGVVEDLITALSRFRTLSVVARNSTFAYKGRAVDIRAVARDLGVRYVLEGSVRSAGTRVRITAQLIDGTSGAHLWADKFDGMTVDILSFQDEITRSVIGLIEPHIRRAEVDRTRSKQDESLDAWDLYAQAQPLVNSPDVSGYSRAIELLERAIALAPTLAPALALASWAHEKRKTFGGVAPASVDDAALALQLARRALDADPDDAVAMALLGWQMILFREDYGGLAHCARACELNPNSRAVLDLAAIAHISAGGLPDAIDCATRAVQLSPSAPDAYMCVNHIAAAHLSSRRYEEAAEWAQRSIDMEGAYMFSHLNLAASMAHLGRLADARSAMKTAPALRPDFTIAKSYCADRFPERSKILVAGLRLAGLPGS